MGEGTQTVYRNEYLTRSGRLNSNPIHPLEDLLPCFWLIHGLLLTMGFKLPISIYSTPPLLFFSSLFPSLVRYSLANPSFWGPLVGPPGCPPISHTYRLTWLFSSLFSLPSHNYFQSSRPYHRVWLQCRPLVPCRPSTVPQTNSLAS